MVVQIIYVFYAIITHEELSESVMGGSAQIGAYLMDLMHDKNAPVRAICDRALCIIAVSSLFQIIFHVNLSSHIEAALHTSSQHYL